MFSGATSWNGVMCGVREKESHIKSIPVVGNVQLWVHLNGKQLWLSCRDGPVEISIRVCKQGGERERVRPHTGFSGSYCPGAGRVCWGPIGSSLIRFDYKANITLVMQLGHTHTSCATHHCSTPGSINLRTEDSSPFSGR